MTRALRTLTVANVRTFVRDRAAMFWTMAFPLIFILMFGFIFAESGQGSLAIGWADEDRSAESGALREAFAAFDGIELEDGAVDEVREAMRSGDLNAVIVVPAGYGAATVTATAGGGPPATLVVYTDPAQQATQGRVFAVVGSVLGVVNLGGRPPTVIPDAETLATEDLDFISYFVPSVLAMALMQLGVFAAIPLVADREKLILKRLAATPLRRWELVGSNVVMRLMIAAVQTLIIVGVGVVVFGVEIIGSVALAAALVVLGSMTFFALGYVIASFAPTEDAANGMTSVVQFPLMFLSGIFFPIQFMPDFLQAIARLMPLTYLADGLRQTMVGGVAFAPLWVDFAVLAVCLVVFFGISARFFRWQ
jgi:ABC-2 type transport system permease protein